MSKDSYNNVIANSPAPEEVCTFLRNTCNFHHFHTTPSHFKRVYPEVSGLRHNEINNNNNKHLLRSNTKDYGGKTHHIDLQNSNTTAPSGRELYHLQFSLQTASPETFGCTHVHLRGSKFVLASSPFWDS
jgi:hypothetical protein